MNGKIGVLAAALAAVPLAAHAQARNGNVYDGTAHQPTAGVQSKERAAGVAPNETTIQNENRSLGAINQKLLQSAHRDAQAAPSSTSNVYGVQPGGVVEVAPNASASSGGTAASR